MSTTAQTQEQIKANINKEKSRDKILASKESIEDKIQNKSKTYCNQVISVRLHHFLGHHFCTRKQKNITLYLSI